MVQITEEEYREYTELMADRDRTIQAIRTQARLQAAESEKLARELLQGIERSENGRLIIADEKALQRAVTAAEFFTD